MIEVELPDGSIAEFPDGTSSDVIKQALRKRFSAPAAPSHPEFNPANVPGGVPGYNAETGMVEEQFGRGRSATYGAADILGVGFGEEAAATLGSALTGTPRDRVLAQMRMKQTQAQEQNPGSYLAGQIGGGIAQGVGLAGAGLSMGANAVRSGASLVRTAGASALDGLILGSLHGAGSGEGMEGRAKNAAVGGGLGLGMGAAAPYAVAGVQAAARPLIAPIMARLRPETYANQAMGEGLKRSGMTADDIANALTRSQADDQAMFNVADSMGHSGQRMLSTVARNPNNMRQTVVDTLTDRQMGQSDRLVRALAEGFDAPDTAAQRTAALTAARGATANTNYEAARQGAGAVDVSGALAQADDILRPGVNRLASPASGIADDSLEGAVRRAQRLLTDGKSNLSDFSSVLRAKQEIGDMVEAARRTGKNNQARILAQINGKLDEALEASSSGYRAANDTFRQQSRAIDAIDTGAAATSGRTRATDNIAKFQGMAPDEQAAFRSGYADPMIARVEASSVSPTTNRARPLMTEKTGQEFPAFAAPGKGDQMGRRIAREQRMFETANTALGGSKTADNLADAAEMSKFDPGVMMNLLRGRPAAAAMEAVSKLANEAKGMPPSVMDRIAKTLLETDPALARKMLQDAGTRSAQLDGRRALAQAILVNMQSAAAGRVATP
jgi:hypothetical protein